MHHSIQIANLQHKIKEIQKNLKDEKIGLTKRRRDGIVMIVANMRRGGKRNGKYK